MLFSVRQNALVDTGDDNEKASHVDEKRRFRSFGGDPGIVNQLHATMRRGGLFHSSKTGLTNQARKTSRTWSVNHCSPKSAAMKKKGQSATLDSEVTCSLSSPKTLLSSQNQCRQQATERDKTQVARPQA